MKKIVAFVVLVCAPWGVLAEIGTIEVTPAATLLVPYFEVDFSDDDPWTGNTTVFTVNNASPDTVVAHVTLWTDLSKPVLDFDIYLTGYDVHSLNLRDIFFTNDTQGLPTTGPTTSLSNHGLFSESVTGALAGTSLLPDDPTTGNATARGALGIGAINGCGTAPGDPPNYAALSESQKNFLREAFSGRGATLFSGQCFSANVTTDLIRGFITIDAVETCNILFPSDAGYFVDGGNGTAANWNVLYGDWFIFDERSQSAQGFEMVHIEASALQLPAGAATCDSPDTGPDNDFNPTSFYCSVLPTGQRDGRDNREALGSTYNARYILTDDDPAGDGTTLLVWRDNGSLFNPSPIVCGSQTLLGNSQLILWDEQENPLIPVVAEGPSIPTPQNDPGLPFPYCTQRVEVYQQGVGATAVTGTINTGAFSQGLIFADLDGGSAADESNQAWIAQVHQRGNQAGVGTGNFSIGYHATQLNNLTNGSTLGEGIFGSANAPTPPDDD